MINLILPKKISDSRADKTITATLYDGTQVIIDKFSNSNYVDMNTILPDVSSRTSDNVKAAVQNRYNSYLTALTQQLSG